MKQIYNFWSGFQEFYASESGLVQMHKQNSLSGILEHCQEIQMPEEIVGMSLLAYPNDFEMIGKSGKVYRVDEQFENYTEVNDG